MQIFILLFILAAMTVISFYLGRQRALTVAGGNVAALNSLPGYYGYYMALWCGIPALFILMFWSLFESASVAGIVVTSLPDAFTTLPEQQLNLVLNEIVKLAKENISAGQVSSEITPAAQLYNQIQTVSSGLLFALVVT